MSTEKLKFFGYKAFNYGSRHRANNGSLKSGLDWYSKNQGGNEVSPYTEGWQAMDDFMDLPADPFFTYCKGRT